jgi:hypothetical protein
LRWPIKRNQKLVVLFFERHKAALIGKVILNLLAGNFFGR